MALVEKNTVENIVILLGSILLFNGLVNTPVVGDFFRKQPLIIVGIALVLIIFKDKIANTIGG